MATDPLQRGAKTYEIRNAPVFSDYVVDASTWRVSEVYLGKTDTPDNEGNISNKTFMDHGHRASCEWSIKAGKDPVAQGDEVVDAGGTRWLVEEEPETFNYGGKPLRQSVRLITSDALYPGEASA